MRILHVIETLSPRYGGPISVLKSLACQQARDGHDVTILTTNVDYPAGVLCSSGVGSIGEGLVHVIYCASEIHSLKLSISLARYLNIHAREFDIFHIHGLYRFPPTYAAYFARTRGIPYVIRPHGSLDPYLYQRSNKNLFLKRLWERWFDIPNLNGASAIHYTAEDERQLAAFLQLQAPSFVAPNGIEWNQFEILPKRGVFREIYQIKDAPLVLFLGRLHHKKGLDILIPAFARVRWEMPGVRLVIVGPDNDGYLKQVNTWIRENNIEDSVTYVDFLAGTALMQAYVDADVFVLPSYTENFGMTVVESMACGLPVVISNHVNIYKDIEETGSGIVTNCDIEEVSRAIVSILKNPDKARDMGQKARRAAKKLYAWQGITDRLLKEYQAILDFHPSDLQQ
ncbi:MAG: glycosyltransferase [Candidatus Contendobacter sp.]|nr:glycosyltransferase [Candidatus Contendobacter sp.]